MKTADVWERNESKVQTCILFVSKCRTANELIIRPILTDVICKHRLILRQNEGWRRKMAIAPPLDQCMRFVPHGNSLSVASHALHVFLSGFDEA